MKKPSICFCSLNSDLIIMENTTNNIGGAELQQMLLAKELSKNGFQVSYIVFDHGQKPCEIVNDIIIHNVGFPRGYQLSTIKDYFFVFNKYWKALSRTNADIYYVRGAGRDIGIISLFCLLNNKKVCFSIASDKDVDGTFLKNGSLIEKLMYNFGINRTYCIIAQSQYQQNLLKRNYLKNSCLIKNAHPLENYTHREDKLPIILWVGTIKPEWKQPELFLKIANEMPKYKFRMVGGPSANIDYYIKIKKQASKIPNLDFCGYIPYERINKYFSQASILVNTSSVEGFTNTFIQAWGSGTPVISLNVDPDEIICKHQLGCHSGTIEKLMQDISLVMENAQLREQMGRNGRIYIEKNHDIKKVIEKYIKIFTRLCDENKGI